MFGRKAKPVAIMYELVHIHGADLYERRGDEEFDRYGVDQRDT